MGGLVGALYAVGYSIQEVEEIAIKHTAIREMINIVDRTPRRRGIIVGHRLRNLLGKLLGENTKFSDTKIPLVVNAVDLISSEEIVFSEGNLVDAVMSTISIPGFFAPVHIGNMELVDGGMLNDVPVSNIAMFKPEVFMAVDVHPDVKKELPWQFSDSKPRWSTPIPDYFLDFYRSELIMTQYITKTHLEKYPPDLFLRPELPSEITTFYGYHHAARIIELGELSANRFMDQIKEKVF